MLYFFDFLFQAITVGASESDDTRAYFSNYGGCVDIFAPGRYITAACYNADDAYCSKSGTSMATPHVAGTFKKVPITSKKGNTLVKHLLKAQ